MLLALALLLPTNPLPAPQPPPAALVKPDWPTARPGAIVASPDWGDYNVYPEEARALWQEGVVSSRLLVDVEGRTVDCAIVRSSGHAELDAGHCGRMLLIRFEPARENGKAVPSSRQITISWQLGEEHPLSRASAAADLALSSGRITDCRLMVVGNHFQAHQRTGCLPLNQANVLLSSLPDVPRARVEVEIAPAGEAMARPKGRVILRRLVTFEVNAEGDPVGCRTLSEEGEVARLARPRIGTCDDVLRSVWLAPPSAGETLSGLYEIRVTEPR